MALLLLIVRLANAQTSSTAVYAHAFLLDNPLQGLRIQAADTGVPLTISGTLSININAIKSSFNFATTSIGIYSGKGFLAVADGPTFSKASDFQNDSDISKAKPFSFTLQPQLLSDILNNRPDALFALRYKFTHVGNSSFSPLPGENIGEYYIDKIRYSFEKVRPITTFSGPNAICSEGTYTIANPGTITLENANGIATLTPLGNNQWKVTRIGNGKIQLKSTVGSNVYMKDIDVGTPPSVLNGPSIIRTNGMFNFSVSESTIGADVEYTVMAPDGVEFTPIDDKNFTLNVITLSTGGSTLMVRVTIKTTNNCGTSQYVKNIGIQI